MKKTQKRKKLGFFRVLLRILAVILETVLLLAFALYCAMYILAKGPSVQARDKFVMSVRETSAIGFLANLYFTDAEIEEIYSSQQEDVYVPNDTSLVVIPDAPTSVDGESYTDDWGLVDEDGDGIILEEVHGQGFNGFMMVVLDPSRVIVGSVPSSFNDRGYTVAQMAEHFDAAAATNAGGFYDPDGQGDGSIPDSLVIYDGVYYYSEFGTRSGVVGFDADHRLYVGNMSMAEMKAANLQYAACFGPSLVVNGEKNADAVLLSGLNPRTAIGQRSDGAILMLVIDGRQATSLGADFDDLADIMLEYGAVNASNLDGGSSTLMWYQGEYINNCASVIGIRPVPTAIIVLKEGLK